jgi:hypothetical protein
LKLGYFILGTYLSLASWYVLLTEWAFRVPVILQIAAFFSGLFFFMYGFYASSNRKPGEPQNLIDKITDALENIAPNLIKAFVAFSSILMFGGSVLFFLSMFFASWGATIVIPLFGAPIMFIMGCLLLYMAIRI